jgi:integrase/recombinase XerD
VRDYLDHLVVERGLAANTIQSYRRDLRRYSAHLAAAGVTDIAAITEGSVASFVAWLRAGDDEHPPLSASSAGRAVVAVRGFHRFCLREGTVATDVAAAVHPPRPPKRLPKALPVADVIAILEAAGAPGTALALRDRALLELLYATGARISEAVGLDVDDVDVSPDVSSDGPGDAPGNRSGKGSGHGSGHVSTDEPTDGEQEGAVRLRGKGGRERVVPVGSFAVSAVGAYLVRARPGLASSGNGSPALFLNARGGRLSRQSAWTVLDRATARAGIAAEVSPHTLRHCFATHLLDGGADVRVVQELLGHASVTTTQVYTLVTVDRLREVYAAAHPRAQH